MNNDLISRSALLADLSEKGFLPAIVQRAIERAPAVDAVEVVRCGKCKHWKTSGSQEGTIFADMEPIGACRYVNFCRKTSDFCSYGEREEGTDNG